MSLNFIDPKGTPNSSRCLSQIFDYAFKNSLPVSLLNKPVKTSSNLTYGYIGFYSNIVMADCSFFYSSFARNTFIIDHAIAPSHCKGSIFRLSYADKRLTSVIFNNNLLSITDRDHIYNHLKDISEKESISFGISYPLIPSFSSSNCFSVLIKRSNILSSLSSSSSASHLTASWLKKTRSLNRDLLVSTKPQELFISPSSKIFSKRFVVSPVTVQYSLIREVCCPTSMMLIPFILHSIPVYLSDEHPLFSLLGAYVPSLSISDSIDLVMSCISKTSFSLSMLPALDLYLRELSY